MYVLVNIQRDEDDDDNNDDDGDGDNDDDDDNKNNEACSAPIPIRTRQCIRSSKTMLVCTTTAVAHDDGMYNHAVVDPNKSFATGPAYDYKIALNSTGYI